MPPPTSTCRRDGIHACTSLRPQVRTLEVRPVDAATIDFEHAENKIPQVRKKILAEIKHYARTRPVGGANDAGSSGGGGGGGSVISRSASFVGGPAHDGAHNDDGEERPPKQRRRSSRESRERLTEGD